MLCSPKLCVDSAKSAVCTVADALSASPCLQIGNVSNSVLSSTRCIITCVVQKVVVHEIEKEKQPLFAWLTGHKRLLFVEIVPGGVETARRRTEAGTLLKDADVAATAGTAAQGSPHEVWGFPDASSGADGADGKAGSCGTTSGPSSPRFPTSSQTPRSSHSETLQSSGVGHAGHAAQTTVLATSNGAGSLAERSAQADTLPARRGGPAELVFQVHLHTELALRVLCGSVNWRSGAEAPPLRQVGLARFRTDKDILPVIGARGLLTLPVVQDGRVQGRVSMHVTVEGSDAEDLLGAYRPRKMHLADSVPYSTYGEDESSPMASQAGASINGGGGGSDDATSIHQSERENVTRQQQQQAIAGTQKGLAQPPLATIPHGGWGSEHLDEEAQRQALSQQQLQTQAQQHSEQPQHGHPFTSQQIQQRLSKAAGMAPGMLPRQPPQVRLSGHKEAVTCCAIFPGGDRVLTGSTDRTAIIWNTSGQALTLLTGHRAGVTSCAVFPGGDRVLTTSDDEVGIVWAMRSGHQLFTLAGARFCEIFPKGDRVLAAIGGEQGAIFSANNGDMKCVLRGHADRITAIAVFPAADLVVTASKDNDALLWLSTGRTLRVLRGHSGALTAVGIFAIGIVWSSVGAGNDFGKKLTELRGHTDAIFSCAVLPHDWALLTVSADTRSILWSVDGTPLAELKAPGSTGHIWTVGMCAAFPSGDEVLTASSDGIANVWSCKTSPARKVADFRGHGGRISACAVFPTGDRVLTVADDRLGIIWPVNLQDPALAGDGFPVNRVLRRPVAS
eukprot:TRINITY_DN67543_c0_g1_i1.p1 TRINITY_DN67543_c0_g1~~TRINITY_DN67543_c0_g1_i1.p1  ORF type:complete len:788 (+),score=137.78 TRINITY_DN67543_c0_g1_i1:305-2668(+)